MPTLIEPHCSDLVFFVFGCIAGNLSNISVRTSLIADIGWFDQRLPYTGDYQFWSRAGRRVAFLLEASNLTFVRQHAGQATFHLNRRGELVAQLYAVVGDLFERLKDRTPQALLRIHSTMQFDAFQRSVAVRKWLATGDGRYLSQVNAAGARQAVFLSATWRWVVFGLSGGGRWGCSITAHKLLAQQIPAMLTGRPMCLRGMLRFDSNSGEPLSRKTHSGGRLEFTSRLLRVARRGFVAAHGMRGRTA